MVKDETGGPASEMFRYSSVVEMLLYISRHTNPDASLAVNICTRYMFSPKQSQELALKILVRYLNQTKYHDLVLNTNYYAFTLHT